MKRRTVEIGGKRWRLRFMPPSRMQNADGLCDHPDTPNKEIWISSDLTGFDLLETLIHEAMHAEKWHLSEESVTSGARDLARLLWPFLWHPS